MSPPTTSDELQADCSAPADDELTHFIETVKELTVAPFWTGFIQGFVSVGVKRYRERRAARREAAAAAAAAAVGAPPPSTA